MTKNRILFRIGPSEAGLYDSKGVFRCLKMAADGLYSTPLVAILKV